MPVIEGNTSGSIASISYNIPCKIVSGFLVNKTGGSIDVNLYVVTNTGSRSVVPLNKTIISGSMYILEDEIILLSGYSLLLVVNGSCDYYFSLSPKIT